MLKMWIETGNDATQAVEDLAELLRGVAERIEQGRTDGRIMDYNGNRVGDWTLDEF